MGTFFVLHLAHRRSRTNGHLLLRDEHGLLLLLGLPVHSLEAVRLDGQARGVEVAEVDALGLELGNVALSQHVVLLAADHAAATAPLGVANLMGVASVGVASVRVASVAAGERGEERRRMNTHTHTTLRDS